MNDFYVYSLIDPTTNKVFYIGKGKGNRLYKHVNDVKNGRHPNKRNKYLFNTINKILTGGFDVRYLKIQEGLTEQEAFVKEKRVISDIGLENLCNFHPGGKGGNHPAAQTPEAIDKRASKMRGRKLSIEHKNKISQSGLGLKRSNEFRKSQSQRFSGENNPMFGKYVSSKTRDILRQKGLGRKLSEETKQKISKANTGKKRSPDVKKKLSNINKGKSLSNKTRQKMSESHRGKKLKEATVDKIRQKNLGKKRT